MYFLTVGPETPVAAAMPLTDSPLLALLLISSTLSTPIISFPDLLMSKSDRIDNCRSKAAVGAGLTISENFRLPEWKAAFTIFVNQTLPNTRCVGFETRLREPYRPYTKGKVERLVRFAKGNFVAGRTFSDITDLNARALEWRASQSNRWRRSSGTVPADVHAASCLPAAREIEMTAEVAMRLCPERKIGFDGFVCCEGRRFGVPCWHDEPTCRVNREGEWIHIYSADMLAEIAVHAASRGRRDGSRPDQWAAASAPEELPTAPVTASVALSPAPPRAAGLEKFDFERRC